MSYRAKDLKAVPAYFRGDKRFGRTTKLVHVPTGAVLHEVMGACPKGLLHSNYLAHQCKLNAELCK